MKWLLKLLPIQFKIWLYKLLYKDIADKGEAEDTELAHINKFEAQLLKRVGGLGKKKPGNRTKRFLRRRWFWWRFPSSSSFAT